MFNLVAIITIILLSYANARAANRCGNIGDRFRQIERAYAANQWQLSTDSGNVMTNVFRNRFNSNNFSGESAATFFELKGEGKVFAEVVSKNSGKSLKIRYRNKQGNIIETEVSDPLVLMTGEAVDGGEAVVQLARLRAQQSVARGFSGQQSVSFTYPDGTRQAVKIIGKDKEGFPIVLRYTENGVVKEVIRDQRVVSTGAPSSNPRAMDSIEAEYTKQMDDEIVERARQERIARQKKMEAEKKARDAKERANRERAKEEKRKAEDERKRRAGPSSSSNQNRAYGNSTNSWQNRWGTSPQEIQRRTQMTRITNADGQIFSKNFGEENTAMLRDLVARVRTGEPLKGNSELKKVVRKLSNKVHPDKNLNATPEQRESFRRIQQMLLEINAEI